jgi:predicted Kef-type K+ transport protein
MRDVFAGLFFVSVGMLVDPAFVPPRCRWCSSGVALIVPSRAASAG